ncbi:CBS domain-containing protein [Enterococcus saccharolyticus]|uniref:CBS domain-containing protein n=1 Tax=Candidatus Enterococcus willemsii TaxID=1857215 RepID=A0ABQ6YYL9_9ENTE|nr:MULTISPECIES: cyclic-di-AMP-binding protein CbpB [Enterococcus]KAF1302928.1 CBS domain-containing protein [Enterococcus sp. CU12B]MCD5000921.1 CBS domain-containing protein [Enterococcus saccharolyticus]
MIGKHIEALLMENQENFLIPADNVATVLYNHPLEHALLVLSKVGYAKIPVLDSEDHLVGLISLANIIDKMMGLTGFDIGILEGLTVADVMEVNVPSITYKEELEDMLHLLVNNSFLPVVDEEKVFHGIVTRKEILKSVNHLVHELEKRYEMTPKEKPIKEKLIS